MAVADTTCLCNKAKSGPHSNAMFGVVRDGIDSVVQRKWNIDPNRGSRAVVVEFDAEGIVESQLRYLSPGQWQRRTPAGGSLCPR